MIDELRGRLGGLRLLVRRLDFLRADLRLTGHLISDILGFRGRLGLGIARLLLDLAARRAERLLLLPLELVLRRAVLALELEMLPNGFVENSHRGGTVPRPRTRALSTLARGAADRRGAATMGSPAGL